MSWAAANLIKKREKEKQNSQKVGRGGVGEAAPRLLLDLLAQLSGKCRGFSVQAQLVRLSAWSSRMSGPDVILSRHASRQSVLNSHG